MSIRAQVNAEQIEFFLKHLVLCRRFRYPVSSLSLFMWFDFMLLIEQHHPTPSHSRKEIRKERGRVAALKQMVSSLRKEKSKFIPRDAALLLLLGEFTSSISFICFLSQQLFAIFAFPVNRSAYTLRSLVSIIWLQSLPDPAVMEVNSRLSNEVNKF